MTAGYSGTPLPRKLGIKPGHRLALLGAPAGFETTLGALPEDVALRRDGRATADVVLAFSTEAADLERRFAGLARRIPPDGGLWIAWPKRASGVSTDLSENVIREIGLAAGLVDNKVCAIDQTWSGLRFVYRVKDRPRKAGQERANAYLPASRTSKSVTTYSAPTTPSADVRYSSGTPVPRSNTISSRNVIDVSPGSHPGRSPDDSAGVV